MITALDFMTDLKDNKIRPMYILCGEEYGIKMEYLDLLKQKFTSVVEIESARHTISTFTHKSLFNLNTPLYISRYDKEFLSGLNQDYANEIQNLQFKGTVVLIYEDESSRQKCDKYLPKYTLQIPNIAPDKISKHLKKQYNLPDSVIKYVSQMASNYSEAKSIANNLTRLDQDRLNQLTYDDILFLSGKDHNFEGTNTKVMIAAKDYRHLVQILDQMDDPTQMIHTIMSTMIDLERALTSTYKGDYAKYLKLWKIEDVYNMFMLSYDMLVKTRQYYNNTYDAALVLLEVMCWSRIPSLEALEVDLKWT